ncbi:MAG: EF-hand domain-containing protein [Xenococcaceae cyanobacterium]
MLTQLQKRKLTKLFSMYDANHSGMLNFSDFEAIVQKLAQLRNWTSGSAQYQALLHKYMYDWTRLKGSVDLTRDHKVNLDEWFTYFEGVLGNSERYQKEVSSLVAQVIDVFDSDSDGKMSKEEWGEMLKTYNVSPVYLEMVFPQLDRDNDGFLSKEEILQMLHDFLASTDANVAGNFMFGPY